MLAVSLELAAQTYTVLYRFDTNSGGPIGRLLVSGDMIYGAALPNTIDGAVYGIHTNGTGYSGWDLVYNGTPWAGVVQAGATLCGPTTTSYGRIYAYVPGFSYQIIKYFNGSDGSQLMTELTPNGSTLYGTTFGGGSAGAGVLFNINADGTGFNVLYSFPTNTIESGPNSPLILSGSTLYGSTLARGANGGGIIPDVRSQCAFHRPSSRTVAKTGRDAALWLCGVASGEGINTWVKPQHPRTDTLTHCSTAR